MTLDTITAGDTMRVRIVADDYPDAPYDDGGSPIVRIQYVGAYGEYRAEQVTEVTSYVLPDEIVTAFGRWRNQEETLERYLRIYHGVTAVKYLTTRHGDEYATCDPTAWRELTGAPAGSVDMDEYEAYLDGAVYGYMVEQLVTWQRAGDPTETREDWETVDSCFGFYGYTDYLQTAAREALESADKS